MTAPPTAASMVCSPCIGICRLNAQHMCIGCGRMGAEIAEWPGASDARRLTIIDIARARLAPGAHDDAGPLAQVPHE